MRLPSPHSAAKRIGAALTEAVRRAADDLWPLLQGTAAATTAWVIARYVLGFPDPFFAPIAAVVALNTALGERGLNALRLLQGVILGILVGESVLVLLGGGLGSMALAIFVATAIARGLGGARIVVAQAAVGAILTIAVADGQAGPDRLRDALVGGGVALVFSQLLFSPAPLALLRRAEERLLTRISAGLRQSARGLAHQDDQLAADAIESLRGLSAELGELERSLRASARVSRRTLTGRLQRALVVHESENANHLDLLHASALLVARGAQAVDARDGVILAPQLLELADVLAALSDGLGDRDERQQAADQALTLATAPARLEAHPESAAATMLIAKRALAIDIIIFAGVDAEQAVDAVRRGRLEHRVSAPDARRSGIVGRAWSWLRERVGRPLRRRA